MTASWVSRPHTKCRVCAAPLGAPYLDLGEQPLANALVHTKPSGEWVDEEYRFPLQVVLCSQCGLSQLTVVVNPEILYAGYRFRSGASEAWVEHCLELASRCGDGLQEDRRLRVLDIAANDGTQLKAFKGWGWEVHGVDPAPADYNILKGFWSEEFARVVFPSACMDLVIAQNVLGHVDDPISFLRACKTVLAPEGRIVVEVPHVGELMEGCAFDTIYHEHLTYWDGWTMEEAAEAAGLQMNEANSLTIHGGSRRYWLAHKGSPRPAWGPSPHRAWHALRQRQAEEFAEDVKKNLHATTCLLSTDPFTPPPRVLGWGASAKAAVYLNTLHLEHPGEWQPPSAIIDDTPEKQGMLIPGVHIPIIACPDDLSDVDVLWLTSWNNAENLKKKARLKKFAGKFLLTNGTPRLED